MELSPFFRRLCAQMKTGMREAALQINKDYRMDRTKYRFLYQNQTSKNGPLGSRDRRVPICIGEVLALLAKTNSQLQEEWKETNIKTFTQAMEKDSPLYRPPMQSGRVFPLVLLPGEKCQRHKGQFRKFMTDDLHPFRASLAGVINDEKMGNGLFIGLRQRGQIWRWFDAYIQVKKPEKLLRYEVSADNIIWRSAEDELCGSFPVPEKVKLELPDVFDGREISLFSLLHSQGRSPPDIFVYIEKLCVSVEEGRWVLNLSNECITHRAIDYFDPNRKGTNKGKVPNPVIGDVNLGFDDDYEYAELDGMEPIIADADDVSIIERIRRDAPYMEEIRAEAAKKIDTKLYSFTVDKDRGLASTYARTTQRNRNRKLFLDAKEKLAKHNMRTLSNSFNMIYTVRGFDDYITQAVAWQQWHAAWIYGARVSVPLRKDMATPEDIALLEGKGPDEPDGADRTGIISGSEPPGGGDESSDIDSTSSDSE